MTFIWKPPARLAIARPIRPNPTIPNVFPHTSVPTSWSRFQPCQIPDRASASPSPRRRATAIISVHAKSAVVSSSTPGVFVATTPRFVHAATSILSKPTATFAAIRSFGAPRKSSSLTFSVNKQTNPSLSFTSLNNSGRGGRSACAQYSTSQLSSRIFRAGSNSPCVANTFGFAISPSSYFGKITLTHPRAPGLSWRCARSPSLTIVPGAPTIARPMNPGLLHELTKLLGEVSVFPTTTEHVSQSVKLAAKYEVPVVGRGAGTGLSGGALARTSGVMLVFSRMNRILEFDAENQRAVVQPAVVNYELP